MSAPNVSCEPCGFIHDGPVCSCGARLYLKSGYCPRWQHVHIEDNNGEHEPRPADWQDDPVLTGQRADFERSVYEDDARDN